MERSEKYEPIILDLQKSHAVQRPKRYIPVILFTLVFLGTLAITVAALYYSKSPTNGNGNGNGRTIGPATPVSKSTPTVSVTPTPVAAVKPPEPTPPTPPTPTAQPTPTPTIAAAEAMGTLNLYSQPDNAEIVINGESIGHTPLVNHELKPGAYTVKFSHQGRISEHKITITAGETTEYTHRFEGFGSLNVRTTRSGSDIFINGEPAGQSPLLVEGLLPGTYEIVARKKGYATAEKTVTLGKGEHQEVLITIKRLDLMDSSSKSSTPTPSRPLHPNERLEQ